MQIVVGCMPALTLKTDCLMLGVWQDRTDTPLLKELDTALHGALGQSVDSKAFVGKEGETLLFQTGAGLPAARVLLIGLGAYAQADCGAMRRGAAEGARVLQQQRVKRAGLALSEAPAGLPLTQAVQVLVEGLLLASYRFDRFLTQKREDLPPLLETLDILIADQGSLEGVAAAVERARHIGHGVALARDLVNQPGNVKSPEFLAERARQLAGECGLSCTVLEQEQLEREGFGALLAVAQGSARPPRLIVLEYRGGAPDEKPLALVGKGVVFDSGGISLKPGEKMDEMKMDMAGAAAVFGAMSAAAGLRLPVNLVAIVPAVENLPSASAYRPGDIITSLSGRTIEVLNTDAEGRLILADALTYAGRFEPRAVIDLATLTGACIIALGHEASAVFSNRDELARNLIRAGETSRERLWQLPLWDSYDKQIKSEIADMKNTGGRPAGTITAAAFLQRFVPDCPWAHIDIAGTAWEAKGTALCPRGGTGVGVRLLIDLLEQE
ncbi:cytosolic aminopeptidase, M17 family [Syntrophotalea carbinolica DSM 2380]|uniref:Probable cytosol aminopeptidase n=1 Tax=Syntrophotalea carbinolica (strain DSM 2380 / NBRC 103641 / GraBd1) TaxID=338963 RepID=AMPA_SYNC1|nr:leucyl aminopeptidase [Syntrophotalea carbinolica]Q3A831.1 RecName: Full=Probable cytosol aminopeptidase; AltName: Full=Leucine aminopeptidase; Short=LAP; AltName: Full=Leucyl aminopeptidase [Syntrophotalea carbinolica DSM 2380]ABA87461.1 cytosolic aminopeptidase, M17 family [Syntrophotalea carbinolica DSM 2380]